MCSLIDVKHVRSFLCFFFLIREKSILFGIKSKLSVKIVHLIKSDGEVLGLYYRKASCCLDAFFFFWTNLDGTHIYIGYSKPQ